MWGVNPECLCRKHLLGEHLEAHMFRGTIVAGKRTNGYLKNKLVVLGKIKERHDILVKEMLRRGMNHKSPLEKFNEGVGGIIDIKENEKELIKRCKDCRKRFIDKKVFKPFML